MADLSLGSIAEKLVTAGVSGGASFLGALYQFKKKLDEVSADVKLLKEGDGQTVPGIRQLIENIRAGWRLEFDGFKSDFEAFRDEVRREQEHEDELDEAVERARMSRPDPHEEMRKQLEELKRDVGRLKGKGYVKNTEFAEYVRTQEAQWRALERTLGRMEALLK